MLIVYEYNIGSLEIPSTTRLFFFEKNGFEVDAFLNANKLTETKNGSSKIKIKRYERWHPQQH